MLVGVKKPHSFQYARNQAFHGVGKVALIYLVYTGLYVYHGYVLGRT